MVQEQGQGRVQPWSRTQAAKEVIAELKVSLPSFSILRSDSFGIGGRLRHFISLWRRVSHDPSIINTILGARLPFSELPRQRFAPRPYPVSEAEQLVLRTEVAQLLSTGVIVQVQPSPGQIVSGFFLVTNKDGSKRAILNVKDLNTTYFDPPHFKMETLLSVLPLITRNQWFGSWNVRKGYFNVAVHPDQQRFFCFEFEGKRYMFTCLVMGASVAPRLFSKLMGVLVQVARTCGIDVSFYLDDTLIRGESRLATNYNIRLFGSLLQAAGFLLHETKSVADAVQRIQYLGFVIDSTDMSITLPPEREAGLRKALREALRELRMGKQSSIRQEARLIGLIVAASPATKYGKGHYRSLERAKTDALVEARGDFSAPFTWPLTTEEELRWWAALPSPITTCFEAHHFSEELTTDASLEGWGAIWGEERVFGVWEECTVEPIDELEMRAVLAALQTLPILSHGVNILLNCDNTTAVAYINKMGGPVYRLHVLARQIWDVLEQSDAFMHAVYVPSAENPADELTRGFKRSKFLDLEVQLNPDVFQSFVRSGPFTPTIDWFASSVNTQLNRFCSWLPSSNASLVDAFSHDWGHEPGYMFPPFSLLPRILAKVRRDRADVLLVHPLWPGALWFPLLTSTCLKIFGRLTRVRIECFTLLSAFRDHSYARGTAQVSRLASLSSGSQSASSDARSLSGCVMDFWQIGDSAIWKTIFASHAPGTTAAYTSTFSKFVVFLRDAGYSVRSASIHHVLQFLQTSVDANRAGSTLRSHIAAISFFLKLFDRADLVNHPLLAFFAQGTQRLAPLPKSRVSVWDPAVPMRLIQSKPAPTSLLPASKEALFLLLLATGMRVDDVSKLSFVCELEESTPSRLILSFLDKRKCKVRGAWTTSVVVKEYEADDRLCPAKAICRMLEISASTQVSGVSTLFISSSGTVPTLYTLRRWVLDILREAGIKATPGSCRSAASSRAFADGVSIDEILNVAGWSSQDTFFRYYQRTVKSSVSSVRAVNLMPSL